MISWAIAVEQTVAIPVLEILGKVEIGSWSSLFPAPQTMKGIVESVARRRRVALVLPFATDHG